MNIVRPNPNNNTITLKNGATTVGDFTLNQSTDESIDLSGILFSGNYNDLTNQPTIPSPANDGETEFVINGNTIGYSTANQNGDNVLDFGSGYVKDTDLRLSHQTFTTTDTNYHTLTPPSYYYKVTVLATYNAGTMQSPNYKGWMYEAILKEKTAVLNGSIPYMGLLIGKRDFSTSGCDVIMQNGTDLRVKSGHSNTTTWIVNYIDLS